MMLPALVSCNANEGQDPVASDARTAQEVLFEDGNYAMFIHFGLYSKLEGVWKGQTYYGNAEWIMDPSQAGIPVDEYMAEASSFNPEKFNAQEIVKLAMDAGMKYIVITSKHHEGFAMFDSAAGDFDIVDATPFGRDVIGELAEECHRNGIGIGFYYSQWQDWTAPGGGRGPEMDENGRRVSFDEYFRNKCVPQVNEITTKYGDVELIWFDTPGPMEKKYSAELVDLVKKNQPDALVSSRIGNGMGDYESLGDMEVPVMNTPGRWEGIDVTQTGWGYSKNDHVFKSPDYIVRNLFSTVARGGTFMLNVGPRGDGSIDEMVASSLRSSGEWVRKYPQAIYAAGASPWGHALPWGDAVTQKGKVILGVFDWPSDGRLWVPGIKSEIKSVFLAGGKRLRFRKEGDWLCVSVPYEKPEKIAAVIELVFDGEFEVDQTMAVMPAGKTEIPVDFASLSGCKRKKSEWMEKMGEWKFTTNAYAFEENGYVEWTLDFERAGCYDIQLKYLGEGNYDWLITTDEGESLTYLQPGTPAYASHEIGWIKVNEAGKRTFRVKPLSGMVDKVHLSTLVLNKVEF